MRVLIACESSGIERNSFIRAGHNAWSCDIKPAEDYREGYYPAYTDGGGHIQTDVLNILDGLHKWFVCCPEQPWDLVIAHPPCTHLSVSGARWFKDKQKEQWEAIQFFMKFAEFAERNLKYTKVCIENPISIMSTVYRKPDQIIQPWQFGHGETKATCLWLSGLKLLKQTNIVSGREHRIHKMGPSVNRATDRARAYPGIAQAMADQWGGK